MRREPWRGSFLGGDQDFGNRPASECIYNVSGRLRGLEHFRAFWVFDWAKLTLM
jgi:hypothetical protein